MAGQRFPKVVIWTDGRRISANAYWEPEWHPGDPEPEAVDVSYAGHYEDDLPSYRLLRAAANARAAFERTWNEPTGDGKGQLDL